MQRITTFFLFAFVLDGLLSVFEELLKGSPSAGMLGAIPTQFSGFLLLFSVLIYVAMTFTPRLPKRILLPPILFEFVAAIVLCFGDEKEPLVPIISFAEIVLGGGLILAFRDRSPDGKGLVGRFAAARPAFTWGNFFGWVGVNSMLLVLFTAGGVIAGCLFVENKTGGYLQVLPAGVMLQERRFQRAGQEVRLIGTIHVAEGSFYQELSDTLTESGTAVVLLEGVTDRENRLKQRLNYSGLASIFGLSAQTESAFQRDGVASARSAQAKAQAENAGVTPSTKGETKPANSSLVEPVVPHSGHIDYWSADLDVSAFEPQTIRYMEAVGKVFASQSGSKMVQALSDPSSPLNSKTKFNPSLDLEDKRNAHLLSEAERALQKYDTVIIPWGAVHMPVFQRRLEEWGFREVERFNHPAFSFDKLKQSLLAKP